LRSPSVGATVALGVTGFDGVPSDAGSGINATRTIAAEEEIADGSRLLREGNGTAFVVLRVKPTDPARL